MTGNFAPPPGDTWKGMEMILVILAGENCHLLVRGKGCVQHPGDPQTKNYPKANTVNINC